VASGAQLSPDGRYLALIEHVGQKDQVSVLDLNTRQRSKVLEPRSGGIDWVRWKGDDRLIAGLEPQGGPPGAQDGASPPRGDVLAALDVAGRQILTLSSAPGKPKPALDQAHIVDPLADDPSHVLVSAPDSKGQPSIWKVDVQSGAAEFVRAGAPDLDSQLPDDAMVVRYDHRGSAPPDYDVLGPAQNERQAYVSLQPRSAADGEFASLRIYDFDRHAFGPSLWPGLKYDVSDVIYHDGDRAAAGVCYTADAYRCDFRDPALEADYARAAAQLDGRSLTPRSMSEDGRYWLLEASGPDLPGAYYVLDRKTKRLTLALDRYPGLPKARLGKMESIVYTARDGTRITGYVTRPPGAPQGPLPMIVMPHGGPQARDALTFDSWAQVLATRGYLVFQPNFRGSSGYGQKFVEAGYRQWGGRMQDDITDGVRKLIADGQADPQRVCIFGASFGGYAALFGGAQTPQLYKCVASFAGVSDLRALVSWERRTDGHEARYKYALRSIGDPVKDAVRLKATSPITYARTYGPPVLLIHGGRDESAPVAQSQAMAAALKKAGRPVKLSVYPEEGHSDWERSDEEAALTEVAAFIENHITPARIGS
jgi:dipeptidyl aminopeptidase/acylaminoacyl peptidase